MSSFKFKPLRIFTRLLILSVAGVILLFGGLWVEHRTQIALPALTGPYPVGRAVYDWVDDRTVDALAPSPGTKRELLVWIWYPAAEQPGAGFDDYVPAELQSPARQLPGPAILKPLTWALQLTSHDPSKVQPHSLRGAAVSSRQATYPIVLMRGGSTAEVARYSALAEDLASHGYVVAAFDAPYRTGEVVFPDGRVIERRPENNPEMLEGAELYSLTEKLVQAWSADMTFTLDRLERLNASDPSGRFSGRLDLQRVGAFGHSLGGAEALQFCHDDARCKACIDLDGALFGSVVREGLRQPVMFFMSDHTGESDPELPQIRANFQSIFERLPSGTPKLMIRGANHFMFSDDAVLRSRGILWALRRLRILRIDGPRQLAITTYAIHSFFDAYLTGTAATPPQILSTAYPEIESLDKNAPYF
jgi:dienelactone hydrolase